MVQSAVKYSFCYIFNTKLYTFLLKLYRNGKKIELLFLKYLEFIKFPHVKNKLVVQKTSCK